jgi:hypothetical protein
MGIKARLSETCRVNLHWFLTGKGPSSLESGRLRRKAAFPDTPVPPAVHATGNSAMEARIYGGLAR